MSDFYNKYPYTDFHELNLDWVIERVKKLTEDWLATHEEWVGVQQDWADTEQAWIDFKAYVENYLANLDVQDEIDHKINEMIASGQFETIIRPAVISQTTAATEAWLAAHITQPTTPVVDTSLSISGAAADAAVTGKHIELNKTDIDYLPYTNIFDVSTITDDSYLLTNGTIGTSTSWCISDYIPYQNFERAIVKGLSQLTDNAFCCYYDTDKNFLGSFPRPLNTYEIQDLNFNNNCFYLRFSIYKNSSNDERDIFRFYKKIIVTDNELQNVDDHLIRVEKTALTCSPNLLNHTNDLLGKYMDASGHITDYATYYVSDFMECEPGEDYVQLTYSAGSLIYIFRTSGSVCFYDEHKRYISGVSRTADTFVVTAPANAKYIRFSSPLNAQTRLLDMFGRDDYLNRIAVSPALGDWAYIPYGQYNRPIIITRITEPYIEKDWRGYWHIKFARIYYTDFDGVERYLQYNSYITLKYSNLITSRSPAYKMDTLSINDGYYLVYSYIQKQFIITQTVEESDIVIFGLKNNMPEGILYHAYNDQMEFFQQETIYHTMPIAIRRAIDLTLENSGLLTSESRDDIFSFVHVSDNHHVGAYIGTSVDLTGMAIKYLNSRANFDAIFNTGDELLTATQAASGLEYNDGKVALSNAINAYPIENLVYCEGNHDRGIIDEQFITHAEYYNLVVRHWKDNENVHSEYPHTYYYRDFPKYKIRAICLTLYNMDDNQEDTYPYNDYCGYDQAQMEWLCQEALQLDSGWSAVILVHSAPVTTAEGNTGNGDAGNNPLVLRSILESFMNGTNQTITHTSAAAGGFFNINITTDFADQGPRSLIGVFSGHTHLDRTVEINNINYEAICCGYIDIVEYSGNRGTRYANEISAVCFDLGVVNLTNKTVTLTRVGFIPTDNPVVHQIRTWTYH